MLDSGEEHYNCISALHKSLRGSDENAGLYWLARMLEGGESPLFIARRLIRFASEDVGKGFLVIICLFLCALLKNILIVVLSFICYLNHSMIVKHLAI